MPQESRDHLLQRIQYLQRSQALNDDNYLENKSQFDKVIDKMREMVENDQIQSYLEVDSTYYYLVEKVGEEGEFNIEQHANEIKNFIA